MVVVIWDFDWTITNENTDTWVVQELEPVLVPRFKTMTKTHSLKGWTEIMKEQMNALHKLGRTAQDIREALHRIPVDVEIVEALKLINERGGTQFIVSDANEWFIDRVCEHHNISCCFKAIHSNKAHFNKDGKIIIEPYHSHSCKEDCPPNMCKADIVNKILGDEELLLGYRPLTVYIGDGGGDEHPCRRELTSQDIALSRKGDMFSLWQRLDRYPPNCQDRWYKAFTANHYTDYNLEERVIGQVWEENVPYGSLIEQLVVVPMN